MSKNVAILGASDNPSRFAYKAHKLLRQHGHSTFLVSPKLKELDGQRAFVSLDEVTTPIDTLTMYVGPDTSNKLRSEIVALKAKRVIFNPGSENPELARALEALGVEVVEDCTLVMLNAGRF